MNILDPNTPLHEILMPAPELKQVFENLGIDACRDGGRPLVEVCQMRGLDSHTVVRLLTAFQAMPPRQVVVLELMTLAELCDHLQKTQRIKLREDLARLDQLTRAATEQPGAPNPQLLKFREAFDAFREQLAAHLREEAEELFPLIRRASVGENGGLTARSSLNSRLARMEDEHRQADETLAELRALAGGDSAGLPGSAATHTIAEAFARLDHAIQEQIYTENQVLFPRAMALGVRREQDSPRKEEPSGSQDIRYT